ncbi:hypothetical protein B9479_003339 [Cryptococcus floricola]|uniref:Uncharacterized protein n=1 Tax=Cryptococcus floricola TaxID=2591691 RepID=A0A5D3AZP3_9TREE|nr:hypothetical protein B9479_003339 [Cryptococcus floricola]
MPRWLKSLSSLVRREPPENPLSPFIKRTVPGKPPFGLPEGHPNVEAFYDDHKGYYFRTFRTGKDSNPRVSTTRIDMVKAWGYATYVVTFFCGLIDAMENAEEKIYEAELKEAWRIVDLYRSYQSELSYTMDAFLDLELGHALPERTWAPIPGPVDFDRILEVEESILRPTQHIKGRDVPLITPLFIFLTLHILGLQEEGFPPKWLSLWDRFKPDKKFCYSFPNDKPLKQKEIAIKDKGGAVWVRSRSSSVYK